MIVRFKTIEEKRAARLQFYKDDVFVIAHEAIKGYKTELSIEELFASAEKFAYDLLANRIADKDLIDYEVDEIKDAFEAEDNSVFLILSLAFVKLCALHKKEPIAENIARAMVHRCHEYEDFNDFLHTLDNKENAKRLEGWKADLIGYELKTIKVDGYNLEEARKVFEAIVENVEHYTPTTIENLLNPLRDINDQYGHAFDDIINRLKEKLVVKTTTLLNQNLNYNAPIGQQIAYAGKVERSHDGE